MALLTAGLALLPIVVGALVTTRDAGMAFRDWPSSDGQNMLLYPWLKSAGDKFLEHGHRLAGIAIGLASIGLAVMAAVYERRRWVAVLAGSILAGVVAQGVLGGQRVLLDARSLAFVHGSCAALVFALLASMATVTGRGWFNAANGKPVPAMPGVKLLSYATAATVFVQFVLGGMVRHQGMVLYEHLGFAFVVAGLTVFLACTVLGLGVEWLSAPGLALALLTILQLGLGAAAWIAKFGWGDSVVVYGSPFQIISRTAHVLGGMLLFMTSVVLSLRIVRLEWLRKRCVAGPACEPAANPLGMRGALQ